MENVKKLALAFLPLVGCVILWMVLKTREKPESPSPAPRNPAASLAKPAPLETSPETFQTEAHWLADSIAQDIAEILHFAAGKPGTLKNIGTERLDDGRFRLGGEGGPSLEVAASGYFWSPETWSPWATACLDHLKLAPGPDAPAGADDLRSALTKPTPDILGERAQSVSRHLTGNPLSADAHEQAALLVGAFALREAAGNFHDPRHELNRISAHLAIARALRPEPGPDGVVANLILLTLAGRQQEALDGIGKIPGEDAAWAAALRMRNTGDWRSPAAPASSTLLEQFELARALNASVGAAKVIELLRDLEADPLPEWNRIVMQGNYGVEEGHVFVRPSVAAELEEFEQVHQIWKGTPLEEKALVEQLNSPPGSTVREREGRFELQVVTWGMVAAFHQRHLCQSLAQTHLFLDDKYGVPEAAAELQAQIPAIFGKLHLYPLVWQRVVSGSDRSAYESAVAEGAKLCNERPMLVTVSNWVNLIERRDVANRPPVSVPSPNAWFDPDLLHGTTFDFANRYYDLHRLYTESDAVWDELIKTAPHDYDVIRTHRYKKFGANPTPQQVKECFVPILDYHVLAMREYADKLEGDPDAYLAATRSIAAVEPDQWIRAGLVLARNNRPDLALEAFETGFEKATDRVLVSNNIQWLVDHYFENNRKEDALRVAAEAGETHSLAGLETLGGLRERMGELDKAEESFSAIVERYGNPGPLAGFYLRNKAAHPGYDAKLNELIPGGLEAAALADFTNPPEEGCVFTSNTETLRNSGLKAGDVVVALDGYRVGSAGQFMMIRSLTQELPMRIIYWDGTTYREIEASPPERRFGCDIDDFTK